MHPDSDRFQSDRDRDDYEGFDDDDFRRRRTRRSRSAFGAGRDDDRGRFAQGGRSPRGRDRDTDGGARFGQGWGEDGWRRESRESYGGRRSLAGREDRWDRDGEDFAPGGRGEYEHERSWSEPQRFEDRFRADSDRERGSHADHGGAYRGDGRSEREGRGSGSSGSRDYDAYFGRGSDRSGLDSRRPVGLYYEEWTISGPHTGRGPKGYRRSDEQISEAVNQRLERHGDIDASEIEVSCQDGIVTLKGKVDDRRTKRLAEDCAESIYGARDVMNNLEVDRGFFERLFGIGGDQDDEKASARRESKIRS
jgi:hypothetical protein